MPQLPVYEQKTGVPAVDLPDISPSMGTAVSEAVAKAGEKISAQALQLQEGIYRSEQVGIISAASARAQRTLLDSRMALSSSPEFNLDPAGAARKWAEDAERLGEEMAGQIENGHARELFRKKFGEVLTHNYEHVGLAAQQQRIRIAAGGTESAINDFVYTMSRGTEKDFDSGLKGLLDAGGRAVASGAVHADAWPKIAEREVKRAATNYYQNKIERDDPVSVQAVLDDIKLNKGPVKYLDNISHIRNTAETRLAALSKKAEDAFRDQQYYSLREMFRGDPAGALDFLEDPKTLRELPDKDREYLKERFRSDVSYNEHQRKQLDEKNDTIIEDKFLKDAAAGRIMTEQEVVATAATPKLKAELIRMSKQRREDLYKTDPAVEAEITAQIWKGRITRPDQILPNIGNGLSVATGEEMKKRVIEAQDIGKSGGMKNAIDEFDRRYGESGTEPNAKMRLKRPDFVIMLDAMVRKDNLSDPVVILERAKKLLEPMERTGFLEYLDSLGGNTETARKTREMQGLFGGPPSPLDIQAQTGTSPATYAPPAPKLAPGTKFPLPNPEVQKQVDALRSQGMSDADIAALMRGSKNKLNPASYGVKE